MTIDPTTTLLIAAFALLMGVLIGKEKAHREAARDCICPTCLGPTDDSGTWDPEWRTDE